MPESTPAVAAAFEQLLAALDTEIAEYKKLGAEIFHNGAPRQGQTLLRRATDHVALRHQISGVYSQWQSGSVSPVTPPTPQPSNSYLKAERAQPGLIRNIKGMTTAAAAEKLGVAPATVLAWLGSGALKGYQKVGGTWKITHGDLVAFARDHRDLLVPGRPK